MGKSKSRLNDDIVNALTHWGITDRAKEEFAQSLSAQQEAIEAPGEPDELPSQPVEVEKNQPAEVDPQKLRVKNRSSKTEGQKLRVQSSESRTAAPNRVFANRPKAGPQDFTPIDNIPKNQFFIYYNAMHDFVLPQVDRKSRLLLCVLFRRSHGFNRNWCKISFKELERATGASTNTLRENLKPLIQGKWVHIVSDGYHESTTYGLRIPIENKDNGEEESGEVSEPDPQKQRVKNRGSKNDPQKSTLKNRSSKTEDRPPDFDPQKLRSCTDSTCTGHVTDPKPGFHPEIAQYVPPNKPLVAKGEHQVGNLALKVEPEWEEDPQQKNGSGPYLTTQEESYIQTLPSKQQEEIFDAQDAWDQILGASTRPPASKLNAMLEEIRRLGYRGQPLKEKFQGCLEKTKQKNPDNPVAWMMSALKNGRYP